MDLSPSQQKDLVRKQFRQRIRRISPADRMAASQALCQGLITLPIWSDTRTVLLFAPLQDEPDIWPLAVECIQAGLTVALPWFSSREQAYTARIVRNPARDIELGRFGIREPRASCPEFPFNLLDLVLVPGVAFDLRGRRLGRGKGLYDRILASVCGTTCGIAFDEQISGELPVEPHDVIVDCILTPTRWLQC